LPDSRPPSKAPPLYSLPKNPATSPLVLSSIHTLATALSASPPHPGALTPPPPTPPVVTVSTAWIRRHCLPLDRQ
jgi:hypothetical protein